MTFATEPVFAISEESPRPRTGDVLEFADIYYTFRKIVKETYDTSVMFSPWEAAGFLPVMTEEYPVCYAMALLIRMMREYAKYSRVRIAVKRVGNDLKIEFRGRNGSPVALKHYLKEYKELFEQIAERGGFSIEFGKRGTKVSLLMIIPLYEGAIFTLRALSTALVAQAIKDAWEEEFSA